MLVELFREEQILRKRFQLKTQSKEERSHMSLETSPKQADEKFKISVVSAKDQITRIQGIVARRAFCETACSPGHEVKNWRRAKSELVRPLCRGQMIRDDDILHRDQCRRVRRRHN